MKKAPFLAGGIFALSAVLLLSKAYLSKQGVVDRFANLYLDSGVLTQTTWLGIPSYQIPFDNWLMQEVIAEVKPDFIVEMGTLYGGTALFYATVLQQVNEHGKVITIDIEPHAGEASQLKLFQKSVEVIKGNCLSKEVAEAIHQRVRGSKVLIALDTDFGIEDTLKALQLYAPLVSPGSYFVLENINPTSEKGTQEFLKKNSDFVVDPTRRKFLFSSYSSGFLKRIKIAPDE